MKTFISIVIVAVVCIIAFYFLGTPAPALSLTPDGGPISASRELVVKLDAPGALLRKLTVSALQGGKTVDVLVKDYPKGTHQAGETFNLSRAGLREGPFQLQITSTDSPLHFGSGNSTILLRSFDLQNTPPVVAVLSAAHNITRGGAGLVVYTLSKEVEKTGVKYADQFFPGYRQGGNFYACLFPFPYNMDTKQYVPRVIAVDRAGNERLMGINFHLLPKTFPTDRLNLSDSVLEKVAAEFKIKFPQAATPLEIFVKANSLQREQDDKALYQFARQTSPIPLWQGKFLRLPNSAPRASFAQSRTYLYQGKVVDQQTHLGVDLASLAHSPVPAANRGRVVHAGDLGIYGQCIVIDHGLGLQTVYGHLSQIVAKQGEIVEKGQTIGNTGATGMAAGDHLHFGVILSGVPVNPIEWWDPSWIKNNVTDKLDMGKTSK